MKAWTGRCEPAHFLGSGSVLTQGGGRRGTIVDRSRQCDLGAIQVFSLYEPVFVPTGHSQTFAEIAPEDKHRISHRADAFAKLVAAQFGV